MILASIVLYLNSLRKFLTKVWLRAIGRISALKPWLLGQYAAICYPIAPTITFMQTIPEFDSELIPMLIMLALVINICKFNNVHVGFQSMGERNTEINIEYM